jgi:uncharacterized membrane protein YqjE
MQLDLLAMCALAFLAVFFLLSILALVMKLITKIYPAKEDKFDAAVLSAIATTYNSIYPDYKITKVEEIK